MDAVKTQVAEVVALPKKAVREAMTSPVVLLGVIFLVVTGVLIVEAWRPGIITSPIRRMLHAMGLKKA
jgi:hypothetical protein